MGYFATQAEIASKIGCSQPLIHRLKTEGKIPKEFLRKERSGGKQVVRIHTDYVDYYLENREKGAGFTGKPGPVSGTESLSQAKLKAEISKLISQAQHWKLKVEDLQGHYVKKDDFEAALGERAAIFRQDLESFARSKAPEIVRIVSGAPEMIPDLVDFMLKQVYSIIERYAK